MLSFQSILIASEHPKKLAEFYTKVFNVDPSWTEGEWSGFDVGVGHVAIGPHDKVKGKNISPERMMFNLETKDVSGEFARIEKHGAHVIAKPYKMSDTGDVWIATFSDPDGNYFQLMSPME